MNLNLAKIEKEILKFWEKDKTFKKSLKGKKRFVFFEGPPFANGLPGIHHLLARAFKDVILRYKTMQGFLVERKAGWDTHGLPTEMAAERKLNIKNKKEIEKLSIDKFIKECRNNVFTYKKEWEEFTRKIGFWLDFDNAYLTCDNDYIESLWWILKQIWDKGLLYQDYKVVPYCPRCGTSLSSHEVAQGYKTIKENSIYVKLKLKSQKNTYLLVWTTTPWTLPGNTAAAVNPDFDYVKIKQGSDFLILAKQRTEDKAVEKFKGKDLIGLEYEPLYSFIKPDKKAHYVVGADFVSLEEGTGIVHIAPAFGIDDMEVGKKNNLPVLMTINEEGKFKTGKWKGEFVKEADPLIIEDLKKRKLLYKEEMYEHEYPFCWRCKTPLLYYAKDSWFIKMTAVRKELIKNSQAINWEPKYIKKGRFGEWLKEVKDWNLSRERYWGTPLPIWECEKCKKQICIGNKKELNIKDLHRPFVDKVVLDCDCGGKMRRVPEVVDCWFDSGSMPFAQWHYPFENKERINKGLSFPADYISEAMDQTRGWFYTLLAVSTLLGKGAPYKNVVCLGLVLDSQGQKMSKSRGNIVEPNEVMNKLGADCARFYFYTINPAGEEKRFDFKDCQSLYRKIFDTLWQSYIFFSTYAKNVKPKDNSKDVLDRWILSRTESLNMEIVKNLDKYDIVKAARLFIDFIDDLSNWYIRRSRKRFRDSDKQAGQTLSYVLLKTTKLIAPFAPFFSEYLYQELGEKQSVHLADYPKLEKKLIDPKLEGKMKKVRIITMEALAQRAEAGIKVRQPLAELKIRDRLDNNFLDLIKDEVNVKKISFGKEIKLNTKINKELEKEGEYRELIRNINKIRKEMDLTPKDLVSIESTFKIDDTAKFKKEVGAKEFRFKKEVVGKEVKINNKNYYLLLTKAK